MNCRGIVKSRVIAAVAGTFFLIPSALGQLWIGWGIVKSRVTWQGRASYLLISV